MAAYWVNTQRLLQHGNEAIVKRPKLTEPLLKRPPFRFLHDIISEVTRRTGFSEGLFTPEELTPLELKDKDAKQRYLSKIINCVGLTLDANVPARPAKILAGLEPEQTNIFLQMLAQAAVTDKTKSAKAVYRCLAGDQMPSPRNLEQSTHESASSNQSVSSEKLKRSMYSPSPDAMELASKSKTLDSSTPSQQESKKVDVMIVSGADKEPEAVVVESLMSVDITENNQDSVHFEDIGTAVLAGQNGDEIAIEETSSEVSTTGSKTEFDAKREELQRLREGIQALCQAISPLGKYIDYLQEDAEAMAKEYQFWIKEQQKSSVELERERQCTEDSLQSESLKILELDEEIKYQEELNNIAKAEIFKNDETSMALLHAASTARSTL